MPKGFRNLGKSGAAREIVFLLDCSASMSGSSIAEAKKALKMSLEGLEKATYFNLYRFGSTYEKMFPDSLEYNPGNLNFAKQYLKGIDADLGGTEVLASIKDIVSGRPPKDRIRTVILITDGEVGNEDAVMDLVTKGSSKTSFFTVGIGNGPNEHFIKELARVTG